MKLNEWLIIWLALGVYCSVAAIGGSYLCAVRALFNGYMAGRSVRRRPIQDKRRRLSRER